MDPDPGVELDGLVSSFTSCSKPNCFVKDKNMVKESS